MFMVPEEYRLTTSIAEKVARLFRTDINEVIKMCSDITYGNAGLFVVPRKGVKTGYFFQVIASDGQGWEHVSVSIPSEPRCPTWEEMCYIKNMFWAPENCVIQFHPAEADYVNCHQFTLHLWRPIGQEIPKPDSLLVGLKNPVTK